MAENVSGKPQGDNRPRQDNTTLPNEYPSQLPFGFPVPQGTGAPGSAPATTTNPDPTIEQLPSSVFGMPVPYDTGSPGSAQASGSQAGGATATDPFAYQSPHIADATVQGSTETEAAKNKAGHPAPFNQANPMQTGSGQGQPLIGGRGGRNRGR